MGHTCAKAEKKQEKPTVTIAAPKKDPKVNTPREVVRDYSNMTVRNKYHFRLGLVGTSHSGKSTIGKQMRIGHGANLSEGTNEDARKIIVTNLVTTFKELVHQASRMKIDIENETVGEKIAQLDPAKTTAMTPDLADHIKTLWADEGTKKLLKNHSSNLVQVFSRCLLVVTSLKSHRTPSMELIWWTSSQILNLFSITKTFIFTFEGARKRCKFLKPNSRWEFSVGISSNLVLSTRIKKCGLPCLKELSPWSS